MKKEKFLRAKAREKIQKLGRIMKLCSFFMLIVCMNLSAAVLGQEANLTVEVTNGNIREVLNQIKEQSNYTFVYNVEELNEIGNVTINLKNNDIRSILNACLEGKGFTYSIVDNVIVIRKVPVAPSMSADSVRVIRGIVTDSKKEPLPGVSIIIKGTTIGVASDATGHFELVPPQDSNIVLLFTFVGMKTKTIIYHGEKELKVTLEEENVAMDEVVITGYQTIDRRKNTSSVQSVRMEDINIPSATSIDQMLEGRITNMIVMTNSGEVGVAPKLRIRGTSTLVGNREPLWVVDGIIVQDPVNISPEELNDPDYINRIGNAIAGLNPQDIERIDILKDAAATALYGTKAANGVIVITTKKGRVGPPIITYNMTTTFRQRPRYTDRSINLMNSKERIDFSRQLMEQHYDFKNGNMNLVGYEGLLSQLYNGDINETQFAQEVAKLETMNTDWFKLLTEDSFSHQHTISVSGGSEEMRYYSSIGFSRDNDVIKGDYTQRYTASINVESNLTSWLSSSFQLLGNVSERNYYQDDISPMDYAYNTTRTLPAYDENGEYYYFQKHASSSNLVTWRYNILNELENSFKKQHSSGLTANVNLRFNFYDWLNANLIVSYSNSNVEIESYWDEKSFHATELREAEIGDEIPSYSQLPFGGELTHKETRNNSYTLRLQLNLNKYFGHEDQHNINASGGFELSSSRYNGFSGTYRGYYLDRGKSFVSNVDIEQFPDYGDWLSSNIPTVTDNLTNVISGYATLSYSYYNYFTLNANARVDGSNRFGDQSNNKFLPIWSVSGNYNFSEHEALKTDWIDYMSLKLSFGYQGNMLEDQSPVMLIQKLPLNTYFNENEATVARYPNPNLKWEKTSSFNAGLSFTLLQGKVQLETEYYYKRTKDAFMTKKVASMNGVDSYTINGGDIENQGYNVDVTFMPLNRENWHWTISTSFSKDYNKIKNDPDSQTYDYTDFLNGTAVIKDKAVNTFYSYDFIGLSPIDGGPLFNDMEDQKQKLFGLSKYDTFRTVLKASGRREPYMSGNLSTNLRYKNLRLSALFAYSLGAKTRLFRMFNKTLEPEFNVHKDFLKRWQQPGDEKHTNIPALISYSNSDTYFKYYSRHYSDIYDNIQQFANDYYEMYDYSDVRVVSADYLKCSSITLTYEFSSRLLEKLHMKRLALTLSGTNLFTICSSKLKGQTPTQGGFSEIQLSDRPTYSFGLNVSF